MVDIEERTETQTDDERDPSDGREIGVKRIEDRIFRLAAKNDQLGG